MGNLMDENVGKVIDLMKKRGIYDNALIVFMQTMRVKSWVEEYVEGIIFH